MRILKFQELISLLATAYATYLIGEKSIHANPLIYSLVGVVFSLFMYRVVFDRVKASRNSFLLVLFSLFFVGSWYFTAPTAYEWYLGLSMGVDTKKVQHEINNLKVKISKMKKEIDEAEDKYLSFKASKEDFINAQKMKILPLREEYFKLKKYKDKINHPYYSYIKRWSDLGSGIIAVDRIAEHLYREKLDNINPYELKKNLSSRISSLEAKIRALSSQVKVDIPLSTFYAVMLIVGVLIEVLITHIDYWVRPNIQKKDFQHIKVEDTVVDLELLDSPREFLNALGVEKPNQAIAFLYASFRAYAKFGEVNKKTVERAMVLRTNRGNLYKVSNHFYSIKKKFEQAGGTFNSISANIDIIKQFI